VVPITIAFKYLRGEFGVSMGALIVGLITIVIALVALRGIDETFARDLSFVEEDK
jgi:hypothetical protein